MIHNSVEDQNDLAQGLTAMSIYESLFGLLPEPCLITDCSQRVVDINFALVDLLGYDAVELVGKSIRELFGVNFSRDGCEPAGKLAKPSREPGSIVSLFHKDGTSRPCGYQILPIRDRLGGISGLLYILQPQDRARVGLSAVSGALGAMRSGTGWRAQDIRLDTTLTHLFKLAGVEAAELWAFDRPEGSFLPAFLWGKWNPKGIRNDEVAFSVASRVLENGQAEYPGLQASNLGQTDYRPDILAGIACLPCSLGDRVIGVIWFGRTNRFDPSEKQGLVALADLLSGLLEKVHVDHLARNRGEQLEALRRIEIAIKESYELKVAVGVLLDEVLQQLAVQAAAVLLLRPDSLDLELVARRGFRASLPPRIKFRLGQLPPGKVAADRLPLHIPVIRDTAARTEWELLMAAEGFVGYYGIPLIARGTMKGVLEVFARRPFYLDVEWERFLEAAADQAAIAIDKSELFENWQRSSASLDLSYDATLQGWMRALELRDRFTSVPDQKMIDKTLELAMIFGVPDQALIQLRRGVILHDIGKIGIPDHILFKPGPLDEKEWGIMRRHPVIAYELLSPIPYLKDAVEIPYSHHERWDGLGYPRGLQGNEIPLGARIFALVDVWAAMTSPRPYRDAIPVQEVRKYIEENADRHFDRRIVEVFLGLI